MAEAKHQQPNLFADPNFLRLSYAGKQAAFELLSHDLYEYRVPGLWFFAIADDIEGRHQTERRAELHARCVSGYSPTIRDFFAELKETGWFELDTETSLCRVSFAPLYFPPKEKRDLYRWLYSWHRLPDCKIKQDHLATMRASCEYDPALVNLFDQWVVEMPRYVDE